MKVLDTEKQGTGNVEKNRECKIVALKDDNRKSSKQNKSDANCFKEEEFMPGDGFSAAIAALSRLQRSQTFSAAQCLGNHVERTREVTDPVG